MVGLVSMCVCVCVSVSRITPNLWAFYSDFNKIFLVDYRKV